MSALKDYWNPDEYSWTLKDGWKKKKCQSAGSLSVVCFLFPEDKNT